MKDFLARLRGGSTVTVNGRTYQGSSVSIINGRVIVDGKEMSDESSSPKIEVSIQGNVERLETASGDVTVHGMVQGGLSTVSGDIECHAVHGPVSSVSGDIRCSSIAGSVSTVSGDIKR